MEKFNETKKANEIIKIISKYYNVNLLKDTRERKVVFPRQMAMTYIYNNTKLSLSETSEMFNRDHATVLHAKKTINALSTFDVDIKKDIIILNEKLMVLNFKTKKEYEKYFEIKKITKKFKKLSLEQIKIIDNYVNTQYINI